MKHLRIPVKSDQEIDLSAISRSFRGIIICYNEDRPVGYIQYYDCYWYFLPDIDWEDSEEHEEELIALIEELIKSKKCNHFKVIEFDQ